MKSSFSANSDSARGVVLEHGEAHFQVARNPDRPFIVRAGKVEFRAVGTAFAVSVADSQVEMFVTQGRVAVNSGQTGPGTASGSDEPAARGESEERADDARGVQPDFPASGSRSASQFSDSGGMLLPRERGSLPSGAHRTEMRPGFRPLSSEIVVGAGNHVIVDATASELPAARVNAISKLALSQRLAWRMPRMEFSGTPLAQVIEMINQYSARGEKPLLVLGDSSLGAVRISGILRADNVDTLIGVLQADHGIVATKSGETEIVLYKAR